MWHQCKHKKIWLLEHLGSIHKHLGVAFLYNTISLLSVHGHNYFMNKNENVTFFVFIILVFITFISIDKKYLKHKELDKDININITNFIKNFLPLTINRALRGKFPPSLF
jgi:hypothetical protein